MVDLPSMRLALVLGAAELLASAAAQVPQLPPATAREVRTALSADLERKDSAALTRHMIELAEMGAGLSDASFQRIAPSLDVVLLRAAPWLRDSKEPVEDLRARLRANVAPMQGWTAPETFATVPAEYRLVEGIAWDERGRRLFIGTVIDGRVAYFDRQGRWHEVPLGSPRASLFGMQIDPARRLLWIATGSLEQTAVAGERMTGLIAVSLDTLAVVRRVPVPAGAGGTVGDLTIAADGTVYASNVTAGAIHRCRPGCTELENFAAPGTFRNPQGLALLQGGTQLYLADYVTGLWKIDTRTAKAERVAVSRPEMLDGIDGLLPAGGSLIAIQNGTNPRRIVTIDVPRAGAVKATPRTIFAPDAGESTLGTMKGNDLLFVADSQWERYGAGGALKDGQPPRPTPILRAATAKP